MKDEPEIIKILRKEEMLGKKEEKPREFELVTRLKDIFNKKTAESEDVILDIPFTHNPDLKFMAAVERQLKSILGTKTGDADMNQTDDQEFHTRLIGENDDAGVQRESMAPQKIQQVMEPPEKSKESQMPRRGKTLDASEDFLSIDQQGPPKKAARRQTTNEQVLDGKALEAG